MKKIICQLLLSVVLGAALVQASESAVDKTEEPERWFQIEIIAFKHTSTTNLLDESWNKQESIQMPEPLIDFLQPWQTVEPEAADQSVLTSDKNNTLNGTNRQSAEGAASDSVNSPNGQEKAGITSANSTGAETPATDAATNEDTGPKPYQLLDKDELLLNNEAQVLQRDPAYEVLMHIGWRQPVLSEKEAGWIRLAGGFDYHQEFHYDGRKIELLPAQEAVGESGQEDGANIENMDLSQNNNTDNQFADSALESSSAASVEQSGSNNAGIQTTEAQSISEKKVSEATNIESAQPLTKIPAPWVPELDGAIKIYLERYLHLDTRLWFRRPDKETIRLLDFAKTGPGSISLFKNDMGITELTDSASTAEASANPDTEQSSLASADNQTQKEELNLLQGGFDWQIGDDFLNTAPSESVIERLFNYPIKQTRRMRSKELHYIDHPLVGILIQITPWEPEVAPEDPLSQQTETIESGR